MLVVPAFALLYLLARYARRRKLKRFGKTDTIAHLMPDVSKYKPGIKITLQLIALAAIVMILARPRFGEKDESRQVEGIEAVVCFDVSNSMLAASTDDAKSISRLRRAKLLLEKLIDRLNNDRVALVVFAGDSQVKMPMTTDFQSAKMFLSDLEPSMITSQGTSISNALEMSMQTFSKKTDVHKAIILITDAEDHEGQAVETAAEAAKQGIQVDVVGVGTSKGAKIPLGPNSNEYMTDFNGQEVVTAINEEAAAEIAKAGNGIYVNGASTDALDNLSEQLGKLNKSAFQTVRYKISAEQFPLFAWLALLMLIADIFITDRKAAWLRNINFFSKDNSTQKSKKETKNAETHK